MGAAERLQQLVRSLRTVPPAYDEGSPALWREGVSRLFADVGEWLSWVCPPKGSVERISLADVEALCVTLKGREFLFEPRAERVLAGDARVDLYEAGRVEHLVILILHADAAVGDRWEVLRPTEAFSGTLLTSETLHDVLLEWMREP
jgi:hypothetical protein